MNVNYFNDNYPSNGVYTGDIGWMWCAGSDGWGFKYQYTWKYNDATTDITPTVAATNVTYTSGYVRSWELL